MHYCKQTVVIILSLLFLHGCVSGPQFKPIEESNLYSTLYFYRLPKFGGGGIQPVIRVNGDKIFQIIAGSYSYVKLAPGKHEIALHEAAALWPESKDPYYKINVVVEGGSVSYFRWEAVLKGFYVTAFAFGKGEGFVPDAIGSEEIKKTKLIAPETGGAIIQPKIN